MVDCGFATCDGKKMELCEGNGSNKAHSSQMDVNIELDCNEGTLSQESAVVSFVCRVINLRFEILLVYR